MSNRENVIRAVDSCFDYWLDQHRYLRQLELEHVRQRKAEAIALLKEQEAVEPTRVNTNYEQHWNCGNCNAVISVQDKYCHECGKRIEWKDGEVND
jgi:hypothetical protein